MASQIDICNRALIRLGADTITSMEDNTKEARLLNIVYDQARQELLRLHPWNFAIKRVILASDPDAAPDFGFLYALPLPADCIRVIDVDNEVTDYKIESGYMMCDSDVPEVIYIADIEDTSLFDSLFGTILSLRLSSEVAYNLTNNASLAAQLTDEYIRMKREAKLFDGQEGTPGQFTNGTWLDSRW